MLLDLSCVLSEQHTMIQQDVPVEMEDFVLGGEHFPILRKSPLSITVEYVEERKLQIMVDFARKVSLDDQEETNYIDGYTLDVDQLVRNEILIGWPTKILCGEDCKGICSVCGQNLNEGTCDCEDTSLDPRMSVIRDVFKNFKEV